MSYLADSYIFPWHFLLPTKRRISRRLSILSSYYSIIFSDTSHCRYTHMNTSHNCEPETDIVQPHHAVTLPFKPDPLYPILCIFVVCCFFLFPPFLSLFVCLLSQPKKVPFKVDKAGRKAITPLFTVDQLPKVISPSPAMRSPFHSIFFSHKSSRPPSPSPQHQRQHPAHLGCPSTSSSPPLVPPQFPFELPLSVNSNMGQVNGRIELETEGQNHGSKNSGEEGGGGRASDNTSKPAMITPTSTCAYHQGPHTQPPLPEFYCPPHSAPVITSNFHNTPLQAISATSTNKSIGLIRSFSQSQRSRSRQHRRADTVSTPTAITAGITFVPSSSGENDMKVCRVDKPNKVGRAEKDERVERVERINDKQELKAFEAMVIEAETEVGIHIRQNNQDHDGQGVGPLEGSTWSKGFRLGMGKGKGTESTTMIGYKRSLATAPHATASRSPPSTSTIRQTIPYPISSSITPLHLCPSSSSPTSPGFSPDSHSSTHSYSLGKRAGTKSARSGSVKSARRAEREWRAKVAALSTRVGAGGVGGNGARGGGEGSPCALKYRALSDNISGHQHQQHYDRERERGKSPNNWRRGPVPPRRSTTPAPVPLSSLGGRMVPTLPVSYPNWTPSPDHRSLPFKSVTQQLKPQTQTSSIIHTPTWAPLRDSVSISSPNAHSGTSKPFPFTTSANSTNLALHANTDSNSTANLIIAKSKLGRKSFETLGHYTPFAPSSPPSSSPSPSAADLPAQAQDTGNDDDNCLGNGEGDENGFENINDSGHDVQISVSRSVSIFSMPSTNGQELDAKERERGRQVSVAASTLLALDGAGRKVIEDQELKNEMAEQKEMVKPKVVDGDENENENEDEKKDDDDIREKKLVNDSEEEEGKKNTASQLLSAEVTGSPASPPSALTLTEPAKPSIPTTPIRVTHTTSAALMPATPILSTSTTSSSPPTPYSPVTSYILSASLDQLGWSRAIIPGSGLGFGGGLADGLGLEEKLRSKEGVASLLRVDPNVEPNNMKRTGSFKAIKGVEVRGKEKEKEKEPKTPIRPRHPFTLGKQDSPAPPTPPSKSPLPGEKIKIGGDQKHDGNAKESALSNTIVRQLPSRPVPAPPSANSISTPTFVSNSLPTSTVPFTFSFSKETTVTASISPRANVASSFQPNNNTKNRPSSAASRRTLTALQPCRNLPSHSARSPPKHFNKDGGFSRANSSVTSIKTDAVGTRDKFPLMKRYARGGRGGVDLTPGMESGVRPPKSGLPRSDLERWLASTSIN